MYKNPELGSYFLMIL